MSFIAVYCNASHTCAVSTSPVNLRVLFHLLLFHVPETHAYVSARSKLSSDDQLNWPTLMLILMLCTLMQ